MSNNGNITIICFIDDDRFTPQGNGCCIEIDDISSDEIMTMIKQIKRYDPKKHKLTFFVKTENRCEEDKSICFEPIENRCDILDL